MYEQRNVLNIPITASSYDDLVRDSLDWASRGESKAIFFVGVHGVMESWDSPGIKQTHLSGDRLNPDGMPMVWALRLLGVPHAQRVYGPDSTEALLTAAEQNGVPVGFYGGSPQTLEALLRTVHARWPALQVPYAESPPFRRLTEEEDEAITERIRASGARFVFVGLGCPKQEEWALAHRGRVPAVLFAVGAAFDFLAGTKPQAPRWMMRSGLEWLFRLASEPRRLFKRYFKHNTRFVYLFGMQWIRHRISGKPAS